jgi:hypothetical protein
MLPSRPRTKSLIVALAAGGFSAACNAQTDALTPAVTWAQEVAPLAGELVIYRLKPFSFSSEVIQRLKESAKITDAHKVTLENELFDADALAFAQPDTNASLVIYPNAGSLTLSDEQAEGDATKDPVGVPSEAEARALADALLPALGLPLDGLRKRSPGGEPHVLYSKQAQKRARKKPSDSANPEQVYVRGVHYFQALGGETIVGEQVRGIDVWFGTEGRISLLSVNWLNAYPCGISPAAERAEIERHMRAGEGTWQSPLPAGALTLRVTQQRIVYRDPVKLSGELAPAVLLTVQVETPAGTTPNAFTCSALASEKAKIP